MICNVNFPPLRILNPPTAHPLDDCYIIILLCPRGIVTEIEMYSYTPLSFSGRGESLGLRSEGCGQGKLK